MLLCFLFEKIILFLSLYIKRILEKNFITDHFELETESLQLKEVKKKMYRDVNTFWLYLIGN
jgi:hypothetical protein